MSDLAPTGAYFLLWCLNIILTMFLWPRPVSRCEKFEILQGLRSVFRIDPHSCLILEIRSISFHLTWLFRSRIYLDGPSLRSFQIQREQFIVEILWQSILHLCTDTWGQWKNDLVSRYVACSAFRFVAPLAYYMLEWLLDEFSCCTDLNVANKIYSSSFSSCVYYVSFHLVWIPNSWVFTRSTRWMYIITMAMFEVILKIQS